jgi:integrase
MWAAENMSKGKKTGSDALPVPMVTIGEGGDFMHTRTRRSFIVYKRTSGVKRGSYYAGFLDADTGTYRVRKAIYDPDGRPVTSRAIAEELARSMASEIVLVVRDEKAKTYLLDFWKRDGKYAKSVEARGRPLSLKYVENAQSLLRVWILPFLKEQGKEDTGMAHIVPALLEDLMMWAQGKGASPRNINAMRQVITVPLSYYWKLKGRPEKNPSPSVAKFAERRVEREILTPDEARRFFSLPWSDKRLLTINLLAATTGMRLGECLGLQHGDLRGDWLHVCHNWQDREGVKGPKGSTGVRLRARNVPIPRVTRKALENIAKAATRRGSSFVFYGAHHDRPIGGKIVQAGYAAALASIDITGEDRKRRGLSFHAWRHWYNSMLRGRVDDHALRALTGHSSDAMTQRYTEITEGQRKAVRKVAEGLVTSKKKRIARRR